MPVVVVVAAVADADSCKVTDQGESYFEGEHIPV